MRISTNHTTYRGLCIISYYQQNIGEWWFDKVERVIKETCEEISNRFDIYFLEIGTDKDHVYFLIQSGVSI